MSMDSLIMNAGQLISFFLLFSHIFDFYENIQKRYMDDDLSVLPIAEGVTDLIEKETKLINGNLQPKEIIGRIDFKDVTFTYPSRPGHTVLDKLTFSIQPGKVTAVVGDYGAGKSTLTSLLLRYEPISVLSILNDKS